MQIADFNHEDFQPRNQSSLDDQLLVKFFMRPKQDQAASTLAGRPIFKEVCYVDIKIPGDRTGGACRPARQADISRFPRHYAAFKNRVDGADEAEMVGTPLSEWPMINRALVEELKFFNVHTVEALSTLADVHAAKFMGMNALKRQATEWLERAEKGAAAAKMASELEKRDAEIAELRAMIEAKVAPQQDVVDVPFGAAPEVELTRGQKMVATKKRKAAEKAALEAAQESPPE